MHTCRHCRILIKHDNSRKSIFQYSLQHSLSAVRQLLNKSLPYGVEEAFYCSIVTSIASVELLRTLYIG